MKDFTLGQLRLLRKALLFYDDSGSTPHEQRESTFTKLDENIERATIHRRRRYAERPTAPDARKAV